MPRGIYDRSKMTDRKLAMKNAMQVVADTGIKNAEELAKKTGLPSQSCVHAIKLVLAKVEPRAMFMQEAARLCAQLKLPRTIAGMLSRSNKEFEKAKEYTANSSKGCRERSKAMVEKKWGGDTIPMVKNLQKDYCDLTKALPESMDESGIISMKIALDPKTGVYYRTTVRLVTTVDWLNPTKNRGTLESIPEQPQPEA